MIHFGKIFSLKGCYQTLYDNQVKILLFSIILLVTDFSFSEQKDWNLKTQFFFTSSHFFYLCISPSLFSAI
jgi:hypothetical protein